MWHYLILWEEIPKCCKFFHFFFLLFFFTDWFHFKVVYEMANLLSNIRLTSNKLSYNCYMFENLHYSLQVNYNHHKYDQTFLICH